MGKALAALILIPTVFCGFGVAQPRQFPLETVTITGDQYVEEFVLKWAGLKIGQPVDEAMFKEACRKLQETGLIRTAEYQYSPGPHKGYALVLRLQKETELVNIEIDIPEIQNNQPLWDWLHAKFPVTAQRMPGNDMALNFYTHAIEEYLATNGFEKDELTTRVAGELGSAQGPTVVFQPKTLPKVGSLKFDGNQGISSTVLEQRISALALQSEFTPRQFKLLIEANCRPLYEEHGFLKVAFRIGSQKSGDGLVAVTTTVEEGRTYQLAHVTIDGNEIPVDSLLKSGAFKTGQLANWRDIQTSFSKMESPLRRDGYVALRSQPERLLHDDTGTLDLVIHVNKGQQFLFGELQLLGLDPKQEARARSLWSEASGKPINQEYTDEYLKDLLKLREFANIKGVSSQLRLRRGSNVIDVGITFK